MPKKDYSCRFFASAISFIVIFALAISYTFKYNSSLKYNEEYCNITRLEYPKEIPSNNTNELEKNFVKCSCGRRCTSDMGICNKLFIQDDYLGEILLKNDYYTHYTKCTFAERTCINGETNTNRLYMINENVKRMEKYENIILNSELIECYEYNGIYFMNNYNYLTEMVIFWIIVFVLLFLSVFFIRLLS
tara:strand:+ start:230 stop:799 length:570 start_codon:yes stop_codon:yes gene_type:complete